MNNVKITKKIIFMGLDNAGKTSILRIVKRELTPEATKNLKPTKGLSTEEFTLNNEKIIIWDFGGQTSFREEYFKHKDYKTSGFWVSKAFKKLLSDECLILLGSIPARENGEIQTLIKYLCKTNEYQFKRGILYNLKQLRNKAVHRSRFFSKSDARNFIEILKKLYL